MIESQRREYHLSSDLGGEPCARVVVTEKGTVLVYDGFGLWIEIPPERLGWIVDKLAAIHQERDSCASN